MRYAVFADIHSNLEALDAVIKAYKKEAIDNYICVGDVVGYATNPNECVDKIRTFARVTVAGNHDWASANLFSIDYFNPAAKEAILWTRHNLDEESRYYLESLKLVYKNEDLTLVHGTLDNPGDFDYMINVDTARKTFRLQETNVCFVGHSHVAGFFIHSRPENRTLQGADEQWPLSIPPKEPRASARVGSIKDSSIYYCEDAARDIKKENKYIINVGSVGQPRDGNPKATYCIYDTDKKEVLIKRVDYDIRTTRRKIIEAALPRFLGDRLFLGM